MLERSISKGKSSNPKYKAHGTRFFCSFLSGVAFLFSNHLLKEGPLVCQIDTVFWTKPYNNLTWEGNKSFQIIFKTRVSFIYFLFKMSALHTYISFLSTYLSSSEQFNVFNAEYHLKRLNYTSLSHDIPWGKTESFIANFTGPNTAAQLPPSAILVPTGEPGGPRTWGLAEYEIVLPPSDWLFCVLSISVSTGIFEALHNNHLPSYFFTGIWMKLQVWPLSLWLYSKYRIEYISKYNCHICIIYYRSQ